MENHSTPGYYTAVVNLMLIVIITLLVIGAVIEVKIENINSQRHDNIKQELKVLNNILTELKKD